VSEPSRFEADPRKKSEETNMADTHLSSPKTNPINGYLAERRTLGQTLLHIVSNHGLFLLAILFVIGYAILLPDTFLTKQTFRAIMAASVIVSFLSLTEMTVIASNNYDLSIAYTLGLAHIVAMGLLTRTEIPWYGGRRHDDCGGLPGRRFVAVLHRHQRHHDLQRAAAGHFRGHPRCRPLGRL
jgi:hypothetical protein